MDDEKKRGWAALAGVGLLTVLLIGGYAGAYYVMVVPKLDLDTEGELDWCPSYPGRIQRVAEWAFYPIHQIDRRVRHNLWQFGTNDPDG
jgi:hypothetical protein